MARALTELSPLELLEQAVALLRSAPASAWNLYIVGAAPLLVAGVYGVSRASVHRMAAEEIGVGSALLTALFLWMSWTKIRFAAAISAHLAATRPSEDSRGLWQAVNIQGTQLVVVPVSLLALFPFAWSMSFYGNAAVFAKRPHPVRDSARMAGLWQRQNWKALGLVAAFALIVFLNMVILLATLPSLARIFSGYENDFTRNPAAMLNATFAATAAALTWLVISPLIQAMYVVRCFAGESVGTGADLRAALRRLAVGLAIFCATVSTVHARPVTAAELDSKIRHTLQQPEYRWQNPETGTGDAPAWADNVIKAGNWIRHVFRVGMEWLGARLRDLLGSSHVPLEPGQAAPRSSLRWSIYAALALIAVLAVLLLRKALAVAKVSRPASSGTPASVDLRGDVVASELPEDEWLRLAREALERGDLRWALRAAYLANLAWLGGAGLVAISRFKSNREYEREVRLRTRSDEITSLLKANREVFESAWYGDEEKTRADVEQIQGNLVRMRELAHA